MYFWRDDLRTLQSRINDIHHRVFDIEDTLFVRERKEEGTLRISDILCQKEEPNKPAKRRKQQNGCKY